MKICIVSPSNAHVAAYTGRPSSRPSPERIERTLDAPSARLRYGRVAHRGADVAVLEQFLGRTDITAGLGQMSANEWRSECRVAGRGIPAARVVSLTCSRVVRGSGKFAERM